MRASLRTISQRLNDNKTLIANAIGFQIVWFICVQGHSFHALLAALLLLIFYQLLFHSSFKFWQLLITFSLVGYLGDGLIAYLFQLNYSVAYALNESQFFSLFAPLWLLSLWLAFATTLNHSMLWVFKTPYLTASIALLMVPLSYFAGIQLSGSSFSTSDKFMQAAFFLSEGLWWLILLTGYKKFALSHSNSVIHHV